MSVWGTGPGGKSGQVLAGGALGKRWLAQCGEDGVEQYLLRVAEPVKRDAHSAAWLVPFEGAPCFAKLYRHKSLLRRLLPVLTARRPLRAFRMASALHREGFAVSRPLCCVALPQGVLLLSEALACRDSLAVQWPQLPDAERGAALAAAASALAALHRAGYSHGDCKWHNLLVVRGTCYLVDLEAARRGSGQRRQAGDIGRFVVAAEEAGVERGLFDACLQVYLSRLEPRGDNYMAAVSRFARRVRRRHGRRYGTRPRPLL